LKIELQRKLKALFNEGCHIKVFKRGAERFVSDVHESAYGVSYSDELGDWRPLSEVRESDVRVFKEVIEWAGGK
jgi:hypothetical protein